jgi:mono/diheme cytochrome c family protein
MWIVGIKRARCLEFIYIAPLVSRPGKYIRVWLEQFNMAASFQLLWHMLILLLVISIQEARSETSVNSTYADLVPILTQRCVICHTGAVAPAGLRLDGYEAIMHGSAKGPVVKAGDPSASELIRRIKGTSQPRMPMTGPPFLSDKEIAMFENWVASSMPKGDVASTAATKSVTPRPARGEPLTYQHVAPILATRCAKCHTDNGLMGPAPEGYRLTSYEFTLSSADRLRVVPGKPNASELIRRIRGQARPRMPFDGPPYLTNDEIRLIEDWIAQGARDAAGNVASISTGAAVRLHGILGSGWQLDGLELVVTRRTRIDKAPAPGDYVQVRGYVDETGRVRVERLRRR